MGAGGPPCCIATCVRGTRVLAPIGSGIGGADELPADALCLDYAELPDAVWTRVAPFLGWALDPSDIARMAEEARFDAREPARRAFKRAQTRLDPPSPALKAVAEKLLPLYRELDRRRVSQPAGAARAIRG